MLKLLKKLQGGSVMDIIDRQISLNEQVKNYPKIGLNVLDSQL